MDAPLRLGVGHALDAVRPALELEPREHGAALHLGDHLAIAADGALALRDHLDAPALRLGVFGVHAEQVAREQSGLVAASAGADLEDGALLVGRVLGQQHELQRAVGLFERLLGLRLLLGREGAHLGIATGLVDQRADAGEVRLGCTVMMDRRHDAVEFGQFAGELHDALGVGRTVGELRGDERVPSQDGVEAIGRNGGHRPDYTRDGSDS